MLHLIAAMGCPDVFPPDNAWSRRDGDNLVIRCNNTGETWYLTCKDEEWIGEYNNCTGTATQRGKKNLVQKGRRKIEATHSLLFFESLR